MGAIWRRQEDDWQRLSPSGFPSEEKLHDLVEGAPGLLPLSGNPSVAVLGREVSVGPGYADLIAVEPDGRLAIIEIKLRRNSEARRAVVAQILTYAAYLKGSAVADLESLLRSHLDKAGAESVLDLVRASDQGAEIEAAEFREGLAESLVAGAFRLVLVLDEAPSELVQLVGYLESISSGIVIDLITVSAYVAGDEQLLVPQRVDPEFPVEQGPLLESRSARRPTKPRREVDGASAFEEAIDRADPDDRDELRRLVAWARQLETGELAVLRTVFGEGRTILTVWVKGEKAGLVSIGSDGGPHLSLWRSVFVRLAWGSIGAVEELIGEPVGQGSTVRKPSDELLSLLAEAYGDAVASPPAWNGRDFYVSFGDNEQRSWDEAVRFGFVSAGGGEWYTKTLHQLEPGHRVFAYISKGNGVGGYVGVGEVAGGAMPAKDFRVDDGSGGASYLDVTSSPGASQHRDDSANCEWVVPVRWVATRAREEAVKDSDLFANQNSAVKLTHGYTLDRLADEFGVERQATASA